mgnify:FL=1
MAIGREKRLQAKAHALVSTESDPKAMALKLVMSGMIKILLPLLSRMPGPVLSEVLAQSSDAVDADGSVSPGGSKSKRGSSEQRRLSRPASMARFVGTKKSVALATSDPVADVLFAKMKKAPANELRQLLELLSIERVADISNEAKAIVLRAIARTWDDVEGEPAIAVVNILRSARGDDLEELKLAFDKTCGDGGAFDLSWFVYKRVLPPARYEILQHFAVDAALTEAKSESESGAGNLKSAAEDDEGAPFQLLSDIDDTFYCSFLDRRFPRHCVYPGVVEFYTQTMKGQLGRKLPVFLSARPRGYKGVGAMVTIKQLQHRMGLEDEHITMLLGEVKTGFSNKKIALKKFSNFREYKAIHPNYQFAFVGDNGQGDHIAGEMMLRTFGEVTTAGAWNTFPHFLLIMTELSAYFASKCFDLLILYAKTFSKNISSFLRNVTYTRTTSFINVHSFHSQREMRGPPRILRERAVRRSGAYHFV